MIPFGNNLKGNVIAAQTLNPAVRKLNVTGANVSCKAGDQVSVIYNIGTWTDGSHAFTVWEAPDVAGSPGSFTQVAAANLDTYNDVQLDVNGALNITDNTQVGKVIIVTYNGAQPWVQVQLAVTGSPATGLAAQATVMIGNLRYVGSSPGSSSSPY